ncbi:MAG: hypothetical protein PUC42_14030 [Bacteroidales bacterium]|jgi:hypothetical protein|nr:hypothetical protein [Bacteroidales bacterium]
MLKELLFGLVIFSFIGCKKQGSNISTAKPTDTTSIGAKVSISKYMDTIVVSPSKIVNGSLQEGLIYGKVNKATNYHSQSEFEALSIYDKLIYFIKQNDIKEFSKYISPDMFNYFKKEAKIKGYDMTIEEFAQSEFEGNNIVEIQNKLKNKGFTAEIVIGKINKRVQYDSTIILVMSETTNITAPDSVSFYFENFTKEVGISKDNGKSWSFLSLDERFPLFFKGIFPQKAIDAVMAELE